MCDLRRVEAYIFGMNPQLKQHFQQTKSLSMKQSCAIQIATQKPISWNNLLCSRCCAACSSVAAAAHKRRLWLDACPCPTSHWCASPACSGHLPPQCTPLHPGSAPYPDVAAPLLDLAAGRRLGSIWRLGATICTEGVQGAMQYAVTVCNIK